MSENDTLSTNAAENSATEPVVIYCDKCGESHADQRQRFPPGSVVRGRIDSGVYIRKGTPGRVDGYRPDGRAWFSFNTMGSATTSFCNPDEVLMLVDEEYYATRQDDMMARRRNGESWESIGKSYDLTGTSVKRIVEKGEDELRRVDEWDGEAPPRVRAILRKAGCASAEDARHAIRTGRIRAAWPPNCGQWVIRQICNLIDEPVPALDMPLPAAQQSRESAIPATETGLPCAFTPSRDTQDAQTQPRACNAKIAVSDESLIDRLIGLLMGFAAYIGDKEIDEEPDVLEKARAAVRDYTQSAIGVAVANAESLITAISDSVTESLTDYRAEGESVPEAIARLRRELDAANAVRNLLAVRLDKADAKLTAAEKEICALVEAKNLAEGVADAALKENRELAIAPIPIVLHCPSCGFQHIDAPDPDKGWDNPPHKSHLCHSCGNIWRPADIETNGVAAVETRGKADNWPHLTDRSEWRFVLENRTQGGTDLAYFWGKGGGYTANLAEAELFAESEADYRIRSAQGSHRFIKWNISDVERQAFRAVNVESLRPDAAPENPQ